MSRLLSALAAATITIVSVPAIAADMPARRMPVKAPVVQAAAYNWSGFYVGVHAGYAWGEFVSAADATIDHEPTGGLFGGQIGYNWQVNNIVFGVEADLAFSTIKGDDTSTFGPFTINGEHDLKYLGTVRGRLGIAHNQFLFYVTGGFAYSKVEGRLTVLNGGAFVATDKDTLNLKGWTVGGGVEVGLTQNLSARAEYLYVDFNDATTTMNLGFPFTDQADMNLNVVRFALNYRWTGR
jgi:outer membrane immunogenic protein